MLVTKIETPALVLDMDIFEANRKRMTAFVGKLPLKLRPHYKSHKSTAIAHLQMQDGAKGLCCAKVGEAEDLVAAGIEDVLIANQITDPAKIAKAASLADCCYLTVCVDEAENAAALSAAAVLRGSVIHCLVEYDIGQKRCGVETYEEVYELAKLVRQLPNLEFEGIEAYAGHIAHYVDYGARKAYSEKIEKDLSGLRRYLENRGIPVKEISGVSTGTSFFRTANSVYTEIQPGSYIFMDTAYGELGLGFENALFVLATVLAVKDGRVVTDAGLKSVSTDQKPPVYREYPGVAVDLSEEHSVLQGCEVQHRVGDRLHLIPSHCCTTVNLHEYIYFVRGGKVVDRVPVSSRGKSV